MPKAGKKYECGECKRVIKRGDQYAKRTRAIGHMATVINGIEVRDTSPLREVFQICAACAGLDTKLGDYAIGDFVALTTPGHRARGQLLRAGDYTGKITRIWDNGYSVRIKDSARLFYTYFVPSTMITARADGYSLPGSIIRGGKVMGQKPKCFNRLTEDEQIVCVDVILEHGDRRGNQWALETLAQREA